MHGKTKSFFEDTSIIIIAIVAISAIYYIYSNYFNEVKITNTNTNTNAIDKVEKQKIKSAVKIEKIVQKKIKVEIKKEPTQQEVILPIEIEEKTIESKVEIKKVEKIEKKVDLKLLRSFLIETQYKIRKNIIYPMSIDTNETRQNRTLKFKITILKDGSYEQLTYVNGNKELFQNNKENILKIFPLVIDDKIAGDFPRYLRIKIK